MKRNKASERKAPLKHLLHQAAVLVEAPTFTDLLAYRLWLRPILDGIISEKGDQIVEPLSVDRERLFEKAIDYYKKVGRDNHVKIQVTFTTAGVEEEGKDGSGLRREFYCCFFSSCLREMFVGKKRSSFPSNDMKMVHGGYFEALGRAIVASVLNGDIGFPYLAPAVFHYLIDGDYTPHLQLEDVPDPDIKNLASQLQAAPHEDALLAIIDSREAGVIDHIGWPPGLSFTMETRDALIKQLIRWSMIDKRKHSLDKLKEGLNHLGFLDAMKTNPELLHLLVYSSKYGISANFIRKTVLPTVDSLKCQDEREQKSRAYFKEMLLDMTDEDAVKFFQFVTGSVDPTVENIQITLEFITNKASKFPEANTCFTKLRIPKHHENVRDFKKSFKEALAHSRTGFGKN